MQAQHRFPVSMQRISTFLYMYHGIPRRSWRSTSGSVYSASAMPDMQSAVRWMLSQPALSWCKHERWTWNRSWCILGPLSCNDRKSSSACRYPVHCGRTYQGCYHLGSSCVSTLFCMRSQIKRIKGKGDVNHGWQNLEEVLTMCRKIR